MTFTKQQKRVLSRALAQQQVEPVVSLWDEPRTVYDGETRIDFGFVEGFSHDDDDEVEEWFDENVRLHVCGNMHWDCSGQAFTHSLHWHRNPGGDVVSFVHRIGYDY